MGNGLRKPDLREIELAAICGRAVDPEHALEMATALADALDAAAGTDAKCESVGDLPGAVEALEKARADAVAEAAEKEAEHEKALEEAAAEHEKALEEEQEHRLDVEKSLDEWRRRADEAEAAVSSHGEATLSAGAKELGEARRRHEKTEADLRRSLEIALQEKAVAEGEKYRLQAQAERGAEFWREKARAEIAGAVSAEVSAREATEAAVTEHRREVDRLRLLLADIAKGSPEDAHRRVRVAVGMNVLAATGTAAREAYAVPTRAERRRARGGK